MLLALTLALALLAPTGAAADLPPQPNGIPPAPPPTPVSFTVVGGNRVHGDTSSRNRIYIARSLKQTTSWPRVLKWPDRASVRSHDFARQALGAVFFFRDVAQAVRVTGMWVNGSTLELALELVSSPVYVCEPPPGGTCGQIGGLLPSPPGHPYTLVAVRRPALANVSRVVVTEEVDDAPQVINLAGPPPQP